MTCFRNKKGQTIHSLCKNPKEYARFIRCMEIGMTVEEAFKDRKKIRHIGHPYGYSVEKIKKYVDNYSEGVYKIIKNCCKRKGCSIEDAIRWAARTGRVSIKRLYRKRVYEGKENRNEN